MDILTSVENQRRRLGADAIDLYQIHLPACWHNTPICETMKTLEELVNRGLVRSRAGPPPRPKGRRFLPLGAAARRLDAVVITRDRDWERLPEVKSVILP